MSPLHSDRFFGSLIFLVIIKSISGVCFLASLTEKLNCSFLEGFSRLSSEMTMSINDCPVLNLAEDSVLFKLSQSQKVPNLQSVLIWLQTRGSWWQQWRIISGWCWKGRCLQILLDLLMLRAQMVRSDRFACGAPQDCVGRVLSTAYFLHCSMSPASAINHFSGAVLQVSISRVCAGENSWTHSFCTLLQVQMEEKCNSRYLQEELIINYHKI